jgi:transposase-like protein
MKNTRRKHSDAFKTEVVLEAIRERKTLEELAQFECTSKLYEHRIRTSDRQLFP